MDTELRTIGEAVNNYEQQLRYLLENSNMFVWQFDLQTRKVNFSRSLKEVDFSYSIQDYIDDMVEGEPLPLRAPLEPGEESSVPLSAFPKEIRAFTENREVCAYLAGTDGLTRAENESIDQQE